MKQMTFKRLVETICAVHEKMAVQVARAVNISLTMRNWVIGYYIEEYERAGKDRARYGDKLMDTLAGVLTQKGLPRCDRRELYRYRRFYLVYPQIVETVAPQLSVGRKTALQSIRKKVETLSPQFIQALDPLEWFLMNSFEFVDVVPEAGRRLTKNHKKKKCL